MDTRNVVSDVAYSLIQACLTHLSDVEDTTPHAPQYTRRPGTRECNVYSFPQMWGSTATGFGGMGGCAMTNAQTTVVTGPNQDAVVYFGQHFAYHIILPNQKFHDDMSHKQMNSVKLSKQYESHNN